MDKNYPAYYDPLRELTRTLRHELPGPLSGFTQLHQQAMADGALSKKYKELIALGIAIAVRCDGCMAFHVHDALRAGATR
jgi:AhpD family alkylhydroperoxidase